MKLEELKLKNFRSYKNETTISFSDLTVIVGRNDAGKSSLLDALQIFFNGTDIDSHDASAGSNKADVRISCVFSDLPEDIVLDDQHPTSLKKEFLVREDGKFEVCKVYSCTAQKGKQTRVFTRAHHPTADGCSDLLQLKIDKLKARAVERAVDVSQVNQTVKTQLRRAIWDQAADLALTDSEVELSEVGFKDVWEQVQDRLPVFALFKSDRASTDQDEEAQDPMKLAIKEAVKSHESQLNELISQVKNELEVLATMTVEKIKEMAPELASTLSPQVKNKNWDTLFSVSLTGEDGISINKRGSGTRRLVLLNFFRARAENAASIKSAGTIYAVEEPETSQHPNHQIMLLDAFQELTMQKGCQVILTTHTPTLARRVDRAALRLIRSENGHPKVEHGNADSTLELIKSTLGVLADHDIRLFLGVEGKWDIEFLKRISKLLNSSDHTIPDLALAEASGKLVFVPLGGSSMELWASRLAGLDRAEYYITDRDDEPPASPKYQDSMDGWNARPKCKAVCTGKRELENYIHPDAIRTIASTFPAIIEDFDDVPMIFAQTMHGSDPSSPAWDTLSPEKQKYKASRAKRRLNQECVDAMSLTQLGQSDANSEIASWLREIGTLLNP